MATTAYLDTTQSNAATTYTFTITNSGLSNVNIQMGSLSERWVEYKR